MPPTVHISATQASTALLFPLHQQRVTVAEDRVRPRATIVLTEISGKEWRLVQPLTLQYEQDTDGSHLVSDNIFLVYGVGDSIAEAMRDYTISLFEYYEIVATNVTDEATARQLAQVQQYLQRTS